MLFHRLSGYVSFERWTLRQTVFNRKLQSTPPKTNMLLKKRDYFSREYIFQPLIFRGRPLVSGE